MVVKFHAVDLTTKCVGPMTSYERVMSKIDHTLVGEVTINHGTIPCIGDFVSVDFKDENATVKVIERCFDFSTNECQLWVELIDLEEEHDGSIPYKVRC